MLFGRKAFLGLALVVLLAPAVSLFAQEATEAVQPTATPSPSPAPQVEATALPAPTAAAHADGEGLIPSAPDESIELGEPIEGEADGPAPPEVGLPTPVPFLPPLSLRDCLVLTDRVIAYLPKTNDPEAQPTAPLDSLRRMIVSNYNYLTFRDDLHTSLANYVWVVLDDAKVENKPGAFDTDTFSFVPPVTRISALSFETEDADAFLHKIRVYDEDGKLRQSFVLDPPKRLQQYLPRREVFHLWRRTTVSRIEVEYARATPDTSPKVIIRGGITEQKEFIKTAIYMLGESLEAIKRHEWEKARLDLQEAQKNINDYMRKNQIPL
jgi:hypothetical protein